MWPSETRATDAVVILNDLTRQYFFWEFDRPIYEVFGKTGELDLDTREAQSQRVLTIQLEQ
jgi:hypothetical protein